MSGLRIRSPVGCGTVCPCPTPSTLPRLRQFAAYLQVIRVFDCLVAFLVAIESYWLALGRFALPGPAPLLGAVAVAAAVAFANTLNDLCDQQCDRINHPRRAIVSGRLTRPAAARLAGGLCGLSLLAGLLASLPMLLLTSAALLLSVIYNLWAKKLLLVGHAVVALTLTLILSAGYCSVWEGSLPLLPSLAALPFLFARELIKSICDAPGDLVAGRRSIAAVWGSCRTLWICLGLLALAGAALVLAAGPGYGAAPRGLYLGLVVGLVGPLGGLFGLAALRGPRLAHVRAISELTRAAMLSGVVVLLGLV